MDQQVGLWHWSRPLSSTKSKSSRPNWWPWPRHWFSRVILKCQLLGHNNPRPCRRWMNFGVPVNGSPGQSPWTVERLRVVALLRGFWRRNFFFFTRSYELQCGIIICGIYCKIRKNTVSGARYVSAEVSACICSLAGRRVIDWDCVVTQVYGTRTLTDC
jgi:hypothetical protein